MSLVLDSSVALSWLLPDEESAGAGALLDRVVISRAWVPALWHLEVANALLMAVRRGRIDAGFREASLQDLALLPIQVDPDTHRFGWSVTLQLAERHDLSVYDAAYLELALRLSLPLATLDRKLSSAAKACGAAVLGTL